MTVYKATSGSSTSFLSSTLFNIALRASEKRPLDYYSSIISVVFAAAALESFLNDLTEAIEIDDLSLEQPEQMDTRKILSRFREAMSEAERKRGNVLYKVQLCQLALTGTCYKKGKQPYQDLALLVRLRNYLLHLRPERVDIDGDFQRKRRGQHEKLCSALRSRGLLHYSAEKDWHKSWIHLVLAAEVGEWARATATKVAADILNCFPDGICSPAVDFWKKEYSSHIKV